MPIFPEPSAQNSYLVEHMNLLRDSLQRFAGRDLIDPQRQSAEVAQAIFEAPFVVVSHDAATNPVFNYANQTALTHIRDDVVRVYITTLTAICRAIQSS